VAGNAEGEARRLEVLAVFTWKVDVKGEGRLMSNASRSKGIGRESDRWVRCKGCGGGNVVLFGDGTRRVGHSKPAHLIGVPNSVLCTLYRDSSAEELWALHEGAEAIEPPRDFYPIVS
jgi:hypothetical protein